MSDDLVQELIVAIDAGDSGPSIENTLHHHTHRKASRTLRAVVAAIREVQGMQGMPNPGDLVPLVGWLNIPVPVRGASNEAYREHAGFGAGAGAGADADAGVGVGVDADTSVGTVDARALGATSADDDVDDGGRHRILRRYAYGGAPSWERGPAGGGEPTGATAPCHTKQHVQVSGAIAKETLAGATFESAFELLESPTRDEQPPTPADVNQQRAWADALDAWEKETEAAVVRDSTASKPPSGST
jgi:hypothetical protein